MTTRTTRTTMTFNNPFFLVRSDELYPAGIYCVETDEESLEEISFPVYRRILTVIHLHAQQAFPGTTQTMTIDPTELDAALERDRATEQTKFRLPSPQSSRPTAAIPMNEEPNRQDIDRAENEGMTIHPTHATVG
jgi:hypothetical protein